MLIRRLLVSAGCLSLLAVSLPAQSVDPSSGPLTARKAGPVMVPTDSWVYGALDRVAALGFISDQATGMRPWTRQECIRQVNEAQQAIARRVDAGEAESSRVTEGLRLVSDLRKEFGGDQKLSTYAELESLYSRYTGISGKPLTDGYNFGQTIVNDYGRPYGEGSNSVTGISVMAGAPHFAAYVRGEYEQGNPFTTPGSSLINKDNQIVPVKGEGSGFAPLEMYAGAQFGDFAVTVGKQDLWWGPGESGSLSFSNNAQPFYSFRITSTAPLHLPGAGRFLGGFRIDLIGGELAGHQFPARPLMNGQKLTWSPVKDLEIGFTRWSLFGGVGTAPFTMNTVLRNFLANSTTGVHHDPGDRKSGLDFVWRPPLPGRWVTLYGDFYADDEPTPLTNLRRSAFSPGIYFPRLPGLPKWDLRVEAPSTRAWGADQGGEFFYWNVVYRDANTNRGNLLGSWTGRDGRGLFVQTSHWTSARSRLTLQYRQNRIGSAYLLGGGTQDDGSVTQSVQIGSDLNVQGTLQFERYNIPLAGGLQHDVLASVQMIYTPRFTAGR